MATIHKIPVNFARSISRKIVVEVEKRIDFELTSIQPFRYRPSKGSARSEVVITSAVVLALLLIITIAIKLLSNG